MNVLDYNSYPKGKDMDKPDEISFDDYDELINPKPAENDFDRVIEVALTRRGLLKSVLAVGSVASLGSFATLGSGKAIAASSRFAFDAVDTNTLDNITLPKGYSSCLLYTSPSPRDRTRSRMPSSA